MKLWNLSSRIIFKTSEIRERYQGGNLQEAHRRSLNYQRWLLNSGYLYEVHCGRPVFVEYLFWRKKIFSSKCFFFTLWLKFFWNTSEISWSYGECYNTRNNQLNKQWHSDWNKLFGDFQRHLMWDHLPDYLFVVEYICNCDWTANSFAEYSSSPTRFKTCKIKLCPCFEVERLEKGS